MVNVMLVNVMLVNVMLVNIMLNSHYNVPCVTV